MLISNFVFFSYSVCYLSKEILQNNNSELCRLHDYNNTALQKREKHDKYAADRLNHNYPCFLNKRSFFNISLFFCYIYFFLAKNLFLKLLTSYCLTRDFIDQDLT